MLALALGGIAALCWGVHDLCVRYLSQKTDIVASMLVVLFSGVVCMTALSVVQSTPWQLVTSQLLLASLSGLLFAMATYCLWRAFSEGPVRMVTPIVSAFPVLHLGLALLEGELIAVTSAALVLVVLVGIAIVAGGEDDDGQYSRKSVFLWSLGAAVCFGLTFWLGQGLLEEGEPLPLLLTTRVAALAAVLAFAVLKRGGIVWPRRRDLPVLVLMGLLDTAALALVLYAGRLPGGLFATVTASLFGVITILLASMFLNEHLSRRQWVGVLITFGAIAALGL